MNQADARLIADKYLERLQSDAGDKLAFNYEITEDHPIGFVFFYNSDLFWRTRDFNNSLAGNGPLLVKRESGEIIALPSHQSVLRSIRELECSTEL